MPYLQQQSIRAPLVVTKLSKLADTVGRGVQKWKIGMLSLTEKKSFYE